MKARQNIFPCICPCYREIDPREKFAPDCLRRQLVLSFLRMPLHWSQYGLFGGERPFSAAAEHVGGEFERYIPQERPRFLRRSNGVSFRRRLPWVLLRAK